MSTTIFIFLILFPISTLSSSLIGINYGQLASNLPSPSSVLPLLHSLNATRIKLYDSNPQILKSFSSSPHFDLTVTLPDSLLPQLRSSPSFAQQYLSSNLKPFLSSVNISSILIGNEVLSSNNSLLIQSLLPAMMSINSVLDNFSITNVAVTTAHSLNILSTSFPPSAGRFRKDLLPYISPLLDFLNKTGSPFLINAYPFFAYTSDPKRIDLNYVLFEPNDGVVDPGTGLSYDNMLHAQVDAVRSAIAAVMGSWKGIEVRVSETGWPSEGDEDEVGATAENARKYNGNLMRMVAEGRGTPMEPKAALSVYVFALFNENLKPGPASERHYGLFNPDGTPAYDIGVKPASMNSSRNGGGGGFVANSPAQSVGDANTGGFYDISADGGAQVGLRLVAVAVAAAWWGAF